MEKKIWNFEAWKDTFLILALLGGVAIAVTTYYHFQSALVWSVAATIWSAMLALHARWRLWFTRRLAVFISIVTLIVCLIWQYNIPAPTTLDKSTAPTPLPPEVKPLQGPKFVDNPPENVALVFGSNLAIIPLIILRRQKEQPFSFYGLSPTIYVENDTIFVDVDIKDPQGGTAAELKRGVITVNRGNWDSNASENAFEIVNQNGLVIFQIVYVKPSQIVINGIFPAPLEPRLIIYVSQDRLISLLEDVPLPSGFPLKAIFKYPSWKYPGQFASAK